MSKRERLSNLRLRWKRRLLLKKINTDLDKAVKLAHERRKDARLMADIKQFLNHEIPPHFNDLSPIFYFSRYVATPDYETIFYVKQVRGYKLPIVIGEDSQDILTSHSSLKRNLVKLPVITGESWDGTGIVEYVRIADLNEEQGKQMKDVTLLNGERLVDLHRELARRFLPRQITIVDESEWVNKYSRGKLVEVYEHMLALLIAHGIMLEYYELDELDFVTDTVLPALENTERRFGHKPLLVPLQQKRSKKIKNFNSYPKVVKRYLENRL